MGIQVTEILFNRLSANLRRLYLNALSFFRSLLRLSFISLRSSIFCITASSKSVCQWTFSTNVMEVSIGQKSYIKSSCIYKPGVIVHSRLNIQTSLISSFSLIGSEKDFASAIVWNPLICRRQYSRPLTSALFISAKIPFACALSA